MTPAKFLTNPKAASIEIEESFIVGPSAKFNEGTNKRLLPHFWSAFEIGPSLPSSYEGVRKFSKLVFFRRRKLRMKVLVKNGGETGKYENGRDGCVVEMQEMVQVSSEIYIFFVMGNRVLITQYAMINFWCQFDRIDFLSVDVNSAGLSLNYKGNLQYFENIVNVVAMFYYIDRPCTPSFPIGLVKTKSDFIVRSVETMLISVYAYPFLAFSDLTFHLEDTGIGVFWLHCTA